MQRPGQRGLLTLIILWSNKRREVVRQTNFSYIRSGTRPRVVPEGKELRVDNSEDCESTGYNRDGSPVTAEAFKRRCR